MEVQMRSKKLVKPSSPTPTELQKWRLSFIDQYQPPDYVPIVFYYQAGDDGIGGVPARICRLEESLSETLALFYPLAGRADEEGDDLVVNCKDQGVEFVEAEVNCKLDQHLLDWGGDCLDMLLARPLAPIEEPRSSVPMMTVQVNVFECGGLAVSVQSMHVVTDITALSTFVRRWAAASRKGGGILDVAAVRPISDLASVFPVKNAPKSLFPTTFLSSSNPTQTSKRFVFDGEALSRFRAEVSGAKKRPPSRVELVTSLISKALVSVDRERHGKCRPLVVVHAINLRGRTRLPIPENSFGNIFLDWTSAPMQPMEDSGLGLLRRITDWFSDELRNIIDRLRELEDPEAVRPLVESGEEETFRALIEGDLNIAMFSSWCNQHWYAADFGWGPPCYFRNARRFPGLSILVDTRSRDGIEAWVTLEEPDMERFVNDPDILAYAR